MNRTFRHLLVPCVLALVSTTAACELISSVDRSNIGTGGAGGSSTGSQTTDTTATGTSGAATSSGTDGSGGTGGAATSSSSGSGSTSSSSASSASASASSSSASSASASSSSASSSSSGGGCTIAADCPMPASPCVLRVCTAGACSTAFAPADSPTATQVPGDCKQVVCDGAGDTINGDDDTDVPTDNEVCTVDSCFGGAPVFEPAPKGLDCSAQGPAPKHLCGDPAGSGAGKCVECNATADCAGGKTCTMNVCQ